MRAYEIPTEVSKVLITHSAIEERNRKLADEISAEYSDRQLIILIISNGALIFAADLVRLISIPLKFDTLSVSTYNGTRSTESLRLNSTIKLDLENSEVIIVDDIFDTGYTLQSVRGIVSKRSPKTIRTCVLLNKRKNREINFIPDYIGFTIDNDFVVGYGLDYNESYRNLPDIRILRP